MKFCSSIETPDERIIWFIVTIKIYGSNSIWFPISKSLSISTIFMIIAYKHHSIVVDSMTTLRVKSCYSIDNTCIDFLIVSIKSTCTISVYLSTSYIRNIIWSSHICIINNIGILIGNIRCLSPIRFNGNFSHALRHVPISTLVKYTIAAISSI